MDELKKILLAGVGSIAYTYEKSANVVEELVEKGRLSVDLGPKVEYFTLGFTHFVRRNYE